MIFTYSDPIPTMCDRFHRLLTYGNKRAYIAQVNQFWILDFEKLIVNRRFVR